MLKKIPLHNGVTSSTKEVKIKTERNLKKESREIYFISEQLKNENAVLLSTINKTFSELDGLYNKLLDGYVLTKIDGSVLKMNKTSKDLLGWDSKNHTTNILNLIQKGSRLKTFRNIKKLLRKETYTKFNIRLNTVKGIRNVEVKINVIKDKDNSPIAFQGMFRDITQEIKNEQKINEQQQQLKIIFKNSKLGIVLTKSGKIIQSNTAIEKLLGYSKKELMDINFKDIFHQQDYYSFVKKTNEIIVDKSNDFSINKRYIRKDKSIFWGRSNVTTVKDQQQQTRYQIIFIEDISHQIELEKQHSQLIESLEQKNNDLNDYAHVVSHDLKSPLSGMDTLVNWLIEDHSHQLDDKGIEMLKLLLVKVGKMNAIIEGILEYSSVGTSDTNNENVCIKNLIEFIVDTINNPKNIEIKIDGILPTIKGDKTRFQQIFQNLITNAINAIGTKEGQINVGGISKKDVVEFYVKDNGMGIEQKHESKIFEIFESLDTKKYNKGIGLSIVKKIVNFYGGKIWFTSKINQGTTFYFTIKT